MKDREIEEKISALWGAIYNLQLQIESRGRSPHGSNCTREDTRTPKGDKQINLLRFVGVAT